MLLPNRLALFLFRARVTFFLCKSLLDEEGCSTGALLTGSLLVILLTALISASIAFTFALDSDTSISGF